MRKEKLILILILILAAALRFYDLTYQSLWGDEAFSIYGAKSTDMHFMTASLVDVTHRNFLTPQKSFRKLIVACIRNEGTPPAYFVTLAAWIKLFGSTDFVFRSLSAILGILAVGAFFLLGLQLFKNSGTALLGMLFIAVSPLNIYFSQEVRAYIFANLFVILSCWLFLRASADGSRKGSWFAYGLASLILCYSFYFATLMLLVHFVYLLIHRRSSLRPWFITMAWVGILYAPWCVIGFKTQFAVSSGYASPGPASVKEFLMAHRAPLRYVLDSLILGPMYSRVIVGGKVKLLIEFGLLALLVVGGTRLWSRGKKEIVTFSLLTILIPLVIICTLGCVKGTLWYMKPRYHMWEAVGILLLAAASIMTFRKHLVRTVLACAFCLFSLAAVPYHFYPQIYYSSHAKSDFRSAARIISDGEERGDIIIVNIPGHMIPLNIYYKSGLRQVGMAETGRYDLIEKLEYYTRKRRRVWFLLGLDTLGHGDKEMTVYLDEHFPFKETHSLPGLRLTLYSREELKNQ